MSRGGGRGGRAARPAMKIRTEEEEKLASGDTKKKEREVLLPPDTYPPIANPARPIILTTKDKDVIEHAHALQEFLHYSGYFLKKPPTIQTSIILERYSDRYRKIEGKQDLFDEIPNPSLTEFPRELLMGSRHRSMAKSQFESLVQFRSSHALKQAAAQLVANKSDGRSGGGAGADDDDEGRTDTNWRKRLEDAERMEGRSRRGDVEEEDEDKDDDGEEQDEVEDDDDGDYGDNHYDDDEDGGDSDGGDDNDPTY